MKGVSHNISGSRNDWIAFVVWKNIHLVLQCTHFSMLPVPCMWGNLGESHKALSVVMCALFENVPQLDLTAVCTWQIKSGNWTCCLCRQPFLEPGLMGSIETGLASESKREPSTSQTNSCAKLISVGSQLFDNLRAVLWQVTFFSFLLGITIKKGKEKGKWYK